MRNLFRKEDETGKKTDPKVSRVGWGPSSWFWNERRKATTKTDSEDSRVTPGSQLVCLGKEWFQAEVQEVENGAKKGTDPIP